MYLVNGGIYQRNSNGYPTLVTMPDLPATSHSLADVGILPEIKMADNKPEVQCIFGTEKDNSEIPTHILCFRRTRMNGGNSDIARCRPTSGNQDGGL